VDRNLNTEANAYNYKLEYYTTQGGQLTKFDETETASSVRLEQAAAQSNQVGLKWTALVPWDNANRVHRVYREDKTKPGTFNRIAEVSVQGPQTFTYVDDGTDKYAADGTVNVTIVKDSTYCYKVETVGSYNNSQIKPSVLYNFSQILCVSSSDTTKPCPPVLSLDPLNCDSLRAHPEAFCTTAGFTNHLSWEYPTEVDGRQCDPLVTAYKVYYARYEGDAPTLITTVTTPPSRFKPALTTKGSPRSQAATTSRPSIALAVRARQATPSAATTARCMCCPTYSHQTETPKTTYSNLTNVLLSYNHWNSRFSTGGARRCSLPKM
jgi:hypothetical protein